jgi:hypothetical protein
MTTVDPFLDRLGYELVGAIERRRRRALRRTAGMASATLIFGALAAALLIGLPGASPARALAITSDNSSVSVRVADATADPARMSAELSAAGVQAEVRAVPVAADDVGHWIAFGTLGAGSEPSSTMRFVRDLATQIKAHPDFLTLQKGMQATILLVVGRAASPGESDCTGTGEVTLGPAGGPCPSAP